MTLNELKTEVQEKIDMGYGEKRIVIDAGSEMEDKEIDSIQKDTNPEIEPNYLFFMTK